MIHMGIELPGQPAAAAADTRPPRQSMIFLPRRPYVPPGTLRAALTYPHSASAYAAAALNDALSEVGLEHLLPFLDTADRWDRRLNEADKHNLAFARVLLQRPQWLVVNGALEELDPLSRRRIEALFADRLATGMVNIGSDSPRDGFFTRKLRLVIDPHCPTFRPSEHATILAA